MPCVAASCRKIHPFFQSCVVGFPGQIMQIDTDHIHAHVRRPAQFPLDGGRIKAVGLPHFELVDSRAGDKIAPHEPRLSRIPFICSLSRPLVDPVSS